MAVTDNILEFNSHVKADIFLIDIYQGDWISKLPEIQHLNFASKANYVSNLDNTSLVNIKWKFGIEYNTSCIKGFDVNCIAVEGTIQLLVEDISTDFNDYIDLDLTKFKYTCEVEIKEGNSGLFPEIVELDLQQKTGIIKFR